MNTPSKIFLLIVVGIILLAIFTIIGKQSGTNLTWLAAFMVIILWNVLPKKEK